MGKDQRGAPGSNSTLKKTQRRIGSKWARKRSKSLHDLPGMVLRLAEEVGFIPRHEEIWVKTNCVHENVKDRSRQCHEYILILDKSGKNSCDRRKLTANGVPNDTTVFECPTSHANYGHPATFHPMLPERYICAMSQPGDLVLDMTAGVCTTALSSMKHMRNSISIELYKGYADTGISRLFHFATDYKAKIYAPAVFDVFSEAEAIEPVQITAAKPISIKRADADYMAQYHAIEPHEQLITLTETTTIMKTTPPFPLDSLTQCQQDLIEDLVISSKANEILAATSVITTWSAALGRSWTALDRTRNDTDHPNLQALVLAPTGAGKSLAEKVSRPISRAEEIVHRLLTIKGKGSLPYYLYDTATSSALLRMLLDSDETGFFFSSEAGGLINSILSQSRGKAGNFFDFLIKGFDVQRVRDSTNAHGTRSANPCLSQLLLAQPKVSRELLANEEFLLRGLANRWLLAEIPEPSIEYATKEITRPNQKAHRAWHKMVLEAMRGRIFGTGRPINHVWSEAALEVFRDYQNYLVPKLKGDWSDHRNLLARSRELHKRIALGLLAAEYYSGNESMLNHDYNSALSAYEIIHWFDERRIEIMTSAKQDKQSALKGRIVEILIACEGQEMTLRDLKRRRNITKEQAEEIVGLFPGLLEIVKVDDAEGKAGRKKVVIRLKLKASA